MTEFVKFAAKVADKFQKMSAGELFLVADDALWEAYLLAFPEGTNPIFRKNTVHECSCCRQFVKNLGRVVTIDGSGKLDTVWDVEGLPEPYATVAKAVADRVKAHPIQDLFRTKEPRYGLLANNELTETGDVITWNHFVGHVAAKHMSNQVDTAKGTARTNQDVLFRSLTEVSLSALDIVLDLIEENQLYRGAEFNATVRAFREIKLTFDNKIVGDRKAWCWLMAQNSALCSFKNSAIGSLVWDLVNGVPLDQAVRMYESKVAPTNYKRPTAIVTQRMVDDAMKTINELGVEGSLYRRFARLSDVAVNDVLFVDNDVSAKMKGGIESLLTAAVKQTPVDMQNAKDISVEDFIANEVPKAKTMKLLVENRHLGNFVSLTAPVHDDAELIFKWDNNFAWSYDGDVTDSIKEKVKKAGGKVDAKFRVSLAWFNRDDLDLHVWEPNGNMINFNSKISRTGGQLDVDMNVSNPVRNAVENVRWTKTVPTGEYRVMVHNYTKRETVDVGFVLEVEFDGVVRQFAYSKAVENKTSIGALSIKVGPEGITEIKVGEGMTGDTVSSEKWGLQTKQLVPVDLLTLSPNCWGDKVVGAMHWIFALRGCKNPDRVRGIYNEFLRPSLEAHRKVFELLGAKTKCEPDAEQISGLGFTSARGDSAVVVVSGAQGTRAFNVKF